MSDEQAPAILALEDGTVFRGKSFGARGDRTGEVVFNTSLQGYQEILTDPSYKGQVVCMTYPLIGNYGVSPEDEESDRTWVEAFVVREACRVPSNHRSAEPLGAYLERVRGAQLEITGDDLKQAGVPESPGIGAALHRTLALKLDGFVAGRDEELAAALRMLGHGRGEDQVG